MKKCNEDLATAKEKSNRLEKDLAVKDKEIELAYVRGKEDGRKKAENR